LPTLLAGPTSKKNKSTEKLRVCIDVCCAQATVALFRNGNNVAVVSAAM
jgi:hypothetical protein